ncbi:MAG: hypothetical protein AB7K68_12625 [Bacteriovoracia bacterium]
MLFVRYIFVILALAVSSHSPVFAEGGCTGSCGGDIYRMPLEDLAVDTFNELMDRTHNGPLHIGRGITAKEVSQKDVEVLQNALLGAIRKNDIKIAYSDTDRDCPLKDNGGSCVTFLTETNTKQLSVDIGRILRHQADPIFIQRALIHEAYRLSLQEDVNDQYSRRLAELVQGTIDPNVAKTLARMSSMQQAQSAAQGKSGKPVVVAKSVTENKPEDCDPAAPAKEANAPVEKNLGAIAKVVAVAKEIQASDKAGGGVVADKAKSGKLPCVSLGDRPMGFRNIYKDEPCASDRKPAQAKPKKEGPGSMASYSKCVERNSSVPWICEKYYRGDKSRLPTAKISPAERKAGEHALFCRVYRGLAKGCDDVP